MDRKHHHVLQTAHPSLLSVTEGSLGAGISLKPASCCRSLARSPSTGSGCDPELEGVWWSLGSFQQFVSDEVKLKK